MNAITEAITQFHFLRPYWLLASLPAVVLFALLWRQSAFAGEWKRAISPHLLAHLVQGSQTRDSKTPLVLLLAAWLLASVAMAGPSWEQLPAAMKKKIDARVIVLDLTLSMLASDTPPSRLARAKHKLSDILTRSKEGVTGLVVFAGSAHVVSPLTDDSNTILSMASSLTPEIMPISGSDPIEAIKKAAQVLQEGGFPEGQILFIGDDLPANYATELEALKDTISLSILAVGTSEGAPVTMGSGRYLKDASGSIVMAPVDHARLKQASALFGGRYTPMTADDSDINLLLTDFLNLDDNVRETQREFDVWDDAGGWLALLILPLAAVGYRKGWLGAMLMPLLVGVSLLQSPAANADTWSSLWKNEDQRGKDAFDQQAYDDAAQQFKDPAWKAGALYKAGKFPEAEALYQSIPGADAHYNRGNALAQQGKLEEALSAYDEALKLDPAMADAKANQETVKRFLQQQKPPESQQDGDGEQDESEKDGSKDPQDSQKNGDEQNSDQQKTDQEKSDQQKSDKGDGQSSDGQQDEPQDGQGDGQSDNSENSEKPSDQKQGKGEDEDDAEEQENESSQAEGDEKEDAENGNETPASASNQSPDTEDEQAMEQWLRRVPDDPGGLLRRKFYYESRLRRNNENQNGTQW